MTTPAALPRRPNLWLGSRRIPATAIARAAAHRAATLLARPADHRLSQRLARETSPAPEIRWTSRTLTDLLILRTTAAGPDLIIKHPSSDRGRQALALHYDNLQALIADERLGDWRRLLPRPVTCGLDDPLPYTAEECRPGVTAADLVRRHPEAADRIADAAHTAISALHQATGTIETPGPDRLHQWIDTPLARLHRDVPACRTGPAAHALETIRARLHTTLTHRPILTAWTHGDYAPGNVLMNHDGTEVTGIIDWATAHPDGPAATDHHLFHLALQRETGGEELGTLVIRALRGGHDPVEDALLLLTWLRHVADNLNQSSQYRRNGTWLARNLDFVLREAAAR